MKIGIMSMQRIFNYGSFLQAYSLKKTIESFGNEVEFVDYHVGEPLFKVEKSDKIKELFKKLPRAARKAFPPYAISKEVLRNAWMDMSAYEKTFINEFLPMLGITNERNERPELDALVIGSDEVFNCIQANTDVGYSKELFGADNNAKKLISYAASFGNTTIEGLKKYNIYDEVKGYLKDFDEISIRDLNSKGIVSELTGTEPVEHLDPVFIYDYKDVIPDSLKLKDYIVVYAYPFRIRQEEAAKILEFAKEKNKKIVCLCGPQKYIDGYVAANPFEVLEYIKKADYVITDTFHGSVFSIKFNKKLAVLMRSGHEKEYGNSEKLYDLLRRFNLTDRIVKDDIKSVIVKDINYADINEYIAKQQKRSVEYLRKHLAE